MALNKREQEVQQANLDAEKLLLKQLQACYRKAQSDCVARIQELAGRTDMENIQSIVFQVQYQQAIKKQIDSILDTLQTTQFSSVADYLTTSYENGWMGAFYDLQGQGIPLIIPINQEQVVQAIQNDAKLSKSYYDRLGEDVAYLKKAVKAQVSRGIANGSSWFQVAQELHNKMTNPFGNALYNAMRIARTEGHRVQQQSQYNAITEAKKAGCDIVKQWDSTLDGRTRSTHARLDGQIREIDEYFEVDGKKALYPGAFGRPEEDIHCRCCCAQRAKWALDEDELRILQERADFYGLDKTADFEEFKQRFNIASQQIKAAQDLDSCTTVEQVQNLLQSKGWFNVETINGKVYDSNEASTLTGCDLEAAKNIYLTYEKFYTRYPQLIGKLNGINAGTLSGSTYANCMVGLGHGGITVNTTYFGNTAKLRRSFEGDLRAGFHPAGTSAFGILTHELGHAVDDYLTNTLYAAGMKNRFQPKWVSAELRPKVMRACGLKVADARTEVSGYATKNHYEWFAECFCEYLESDNPRPVAAKFGEYLEELLKGIT